MPTRRWQYSSSVRAGTTPRSSRAPHPQPRQRRPRHARVGGHRRGRRPMRRDGRRRTGAGPAVERAGVGRQRGREGCWRVARHSLQPAKRPTNTSVGARDADRPTIATETARTKLLYGEWLRRARRRNEAHEPLHERSSSSRPSARPIRRGPPGRTRRNRRARARRSVPVDVLTPQEAQIARLAASGERNHEIAAQITSRPAPSSTTCARSS